MPLHKSNESLRWAADVEQGMHVHFLQPAVCVCPIRSLTNLTRNNTEAWGTDYAEGTLSRLGIRSIEPELFRI